MMLFRQTVLFRMLLLHYLTPEPMLSSLFLMLLVVVVESNHSILSNKEFAQAAIVPVLPAFGKMIIVELEIMKLLRPGVITSIMTVILSLMKAYYLHCIETTIMMVMVTWAVRSIPATE